MPDLAQPATPSHPLAERLWLSGVVVLAATPAVMVIWRQVAPVAAAVIALLFVLATWNDGRGRALLRESRALLTGRMGVLAMLAIAYMTASLTWSLQPTRGAGHLQDAALTALMVAVMIAAIRLGPPRVWPLALPLGLTFAAALLLANGYTGSALNDAIGRGDRPSHLNRAAVAVVLFLPLALAILRARERRAWAAALALLAIVAVFGTESWAARLSLVAMVVLAPVALRWPLRTHRTALAGILLVVLLTPLAASHVNDLVPTPIHETLGYGSLTIRGEAWREYAALFWLQPIQGFGLEGAHDPWSPLSAEAMRTTNPHLYAHASGLDPHQRMLLGFFHPHNAPLQVWFELGLIGAILAVAIIVAGFGLMERLPRALLPAATLTATATFLIACVGHGMWTAWWMCTWGLLIVAFHLAMADRRNDQTSPSTSR